MRSSSNAKRVPFLKYQLILLLPEVWDSGRYDRSIKTEWDGLGMAQVASLPTSHTQERIGFYALCVNESLFDSLLASVAIGGRVDG